MRRDFGAFTLLSFGLALCASCILFLISTLSVEHNEEIIIGMPTVVTQTPTPMPTSTITSTPMVEPTTQPSPTSTPTITPVPTKKVEQSKNKRYNFSSKDTELLARLIMAEAEGEGLKGKALVGCVVMNRVKSDEWANTLKGVIYESGQFAVVKNGRIDRVVPDTDCYKAIEMLEDGWDESKGAIYFRTITKTRSEWHYTSLTFLFDHNGHSFFK